MAMVPLPGEDVAAVEEVERYEILLRRIEPPVTDEEAIALSRLFGPDNCIGLAATVLYLVETAPGWPIEAAIRASSPLWAGTLRRRIELATLR
jgi:hypothetical protein